MTIESATYISDLNAANPGAGDLKSEGDDHIRLLKSTVKATFLNVAGIVTPTHTQLNQLAANLFTSYPTFNFTNAAGSYGILQTAGATIGSFGNSLGVSGIAGNVSLRSETGLTFCTGGAPERLLINTAGEIGVNCTPIAMVPLRVQSASSNDVGMEWQRLNATTGVLSSYNRAGAAWTALNFQAATYDFGIAGVVGKVIVDANANVGLGMAPFASTKLWIHQAVNKNLGAYFNAATTNTPTIAGFNDSGAFAKIAVAGAGIGLQSNSGVSDTMFLDTNGDVTALGVGIARAKTSATSRNSTTTLADDPALIAPLGVGTWSFRLYAEFNIAVGGGPNGFKWQMNFSGTSTGGSWNPFSPQFGSGFNVQAINTPFALSGGTTSPTGGWLTIEGTVVVTVAGNLSFQWCQNSAGAQNITVGPSGYINCVKVG